jgi:hypothetical protein
MDNNEIVDVYAADMHHGKDQEQGSANTAKIDDGDISTPKYNADGGNDSHVQPLPRVITLCLRKVTGGFQMHVTMMSTRKFGKAMV